MGGVSMELCPKRGDLNLTSEMYISRELCLEHCDLQNPPEELRIHNQFQRHQVTLCKASRIYCLAYFAVPPENISHCLCKHLGQQHPNLGASRLAFTALFFQWLVCWCF